MYIDISGDYDAITGQFFNFALYITEVIAAHGLMATPVMCIAVAGAIASEPSA